MAGFDNDVVYGVNVDFTGTKPVSGQINQDGELLIGAATAPYIRTGVITGTGGISITNGPGSINIDSQGTLSNLVFHTTSGQAQPSGSQINFANGANITFTGAGNTVTSKVSGTTDHAVQIGNSSGSLTSIAPAASGLVLTSNGVGSDPTWQAAASNSSLGNWTFYFTNNASSIATYYQLDQAPFVTASVNITKTPIPSGNTVIANFATDANIPNLSSITEGTITVQIYANQSAGTRQVQLYAELWDVNSSGVDVTKIGTTANGAVLTGAVTKYTLTFSLTPSYRMGTNSDRIDVRVYASGAVSGTDATVNINLVTGNNSYVNFTAPFWTPALVGSGGTGLANPTAHNLLIGNGVSTMTLLAPSATSGIPLISQGASADPAYGTAVVAGGGTGVTSIANTSALLCSGTTTTGAIQNVASVATGQVLTSAGTSTLPAWSATLPSAVQGNITSTGTITSGTWNGSYVQTTRPAFQATKNGNATNATGDGTTYTLSTMTSTFDQGSNFNTTSGTFTAPTTGIYCLGFTASYSNIGASHSAGVTSIVATSGTIELSRISPAACKTGGSFVELSGSALISMTSGNTATFTITVSGSTKTITINSGSNVVWGYQVC